MTGVKEQKTEGKSQDTVRTPVPTSCNIHGLWRRNATPPNPRRLLSAPAASGIRRGEGLGERGRLEWRLGLRILVWPSGLASFFWVRNGLGTWALSYHNDLCDVQKKGTWARISFASSYCFAKRNTPSVPHYKSFQNFWRVKPSQSLTKIIERNTKIYDIK